MAELKEGQLLDKLHLKKIIEECIEKTGDISIKVPLIDFFTIDDYITILTIEKTKWEYHFHLTPISLDDPAIQKASDGRKKQDSRLLKKKIESWIRDAFLRSGVIKHENLDEGVMCFIKNYDDVIISPDTNILMDCTVTTIILPEIERKIDEHRRGCPNWLLFAVPKLVMTELERDSTRKFTHEEFPEKVGWPKYEGRMTRRALQEILEIDTNVDLKGVSIMTVGNIPHNYDLYKNDHARLDSEIRNQVRDFISQINFHKGIFFLTQDRVCSMMARAEGLQSLFLQKPEYKELIHLDLKSKNIERVLYELIVTFGEIIIDRLGAFGIYWPGKQVIDWEKSRVVISSLDNNISKECKKIIMNNISELTNVKM